MRILHTSDWHLGRTLHGVDLLEHQAGFLDHLVELVRSEDVGAVVVSGDVYDRAVPPVEAVQLLADALPYLDPHTVRRALADDDASDGLLPRSHEAVLAAAMRRGRHPPRPPGC